MNTRMLIVIALALIFGFVSGYGSRMPETVITGDVTVPEPTTSNCFSTAIADRDSIPIEGVGLFYTYIKFQDKLRENRQVCMPILTTTPHEKGSSISYVLHEMPMLMKKSGEDEWETWGHFIYFGI